MTKKSLIKRSDYNRVLITETLPYETPIIFSNDGLYDRIKSLNDASEFEKQLTRFMVFGEGSGGAVKATKPYLYKIRKNTLEYRRLALLHPASQWKIREFYRQYDKLILHFCSVSPATIRSPKSIASTFFSKGSWDNVYKYKSGNVSSIDMDGYAKHAPSFFSYKGYDRLYKFFSSTDYFNLEKKFEVQMKLDVAKCFDSIYTHSLAWATKEKEFIKNNLNSSTFGDDFDLVIRHGNDNETNGIPIGPEISRIFSEIIFQKIDKEVTIKLLKDSMEFGVDYVFRRYVDDVYIFSRSEESVKKIYSLYSDTLTRFNLHANTAKAEITFRPFVSKKSRLIHGASNIVNDFFDSFIPKSEPGQLTPTHIAHPWKLSKSFIDSIKNLCAHNEINYDEVSSFIISSVAERVKRLVNIECEVSNEDTRKYFHAANVIIEISFFLYSVSPSVSASYKLSTIIILLMRFIRSRVKSHEDEVSHKIYDLTCQLLLNESQRQRSTPIQGFVNLEFINVLLAARELGEPYLIPESVIEGIFPGADEFSYFTATSCLFYIRDSEGYDRIRKSLIAYLRRELLDLKDIFISSEKAHLLFDALGCPYIPSELRKKWMNAIAKKIGLNTLDDVQAEELAQKMTTSYWQVNWADVDLLNSLEKKELKQAY